MTEDGDGAEVVPLHPGPEDAPVQREERVWCRHSRVRLDTEARRVYCRECGREVDAFSFLEHLAGEWERYDRSVRERMAEARRLGARVEELKREERNAKARRRRRAVSS